MITPFNRGTGLIIIEARNSNPNGDPDQESDPRMLEADGRGVISPVSFKRKLRDIVAAEGAAYLLAVEKLVLPTANEGRRYGILESRGRDRNAIGKMSAPEFQNAFWDARIFGNTFLESLKALAGEEGEEETKAKKPKSHEKDTSHFISTGVVQFGVGVSVAPIEIDRMTTTNKAGVQKDKDRGMAPLGFRVVRHAIYAMPFFVNPALAAKTGADFKDLELLKFLVPHAYTQTASAIRPFISILHAWYGEHKTPLGSCPDSLFIDALTPTLMKPDRVPSKREDYQIPITLPGEIHSRFESVTDLCQG